MRQSGLSGKNLRWSREGLAHPKRITRAYLHDKIFFFFLLKYSLSNKNVAERRRAGLPEAAASLMAQEQEYKHPNVCVPTPCLSGVAGQQQKEDPAQTPQRVWLLAPACLSHTSCSPQFHTGVYCHFSHPQRHDQCDRRSPQDVSGEKNQKKTGRKGRARDLTKPGWA